MCVKEEVLSLNSLCCHKQYHRNVVQSNLDVE